MGIKEFLDRMNRIGWMGDVGVGELFVGKWI